MYEGFDIPVCFFFDIGLRVVGTAFSESGSLSGNGFMVDGDRYGCHEFYLDRR